MLPFSGHLWTLRPLLGGRHRSDPLPPSRAWSLRLADPSVGEVRLTGRLHRQEGADALVVVVHGLAGSADSHYVWSATREAWRRGASVLRLHLRGADRCGEDIYHAGLAEDLGAVLASPEVAASPRRCLLGYSVGGHLALRAATAPDAAIDAVAAVCAPLDLEIAARALDRPSRWPYRRYVLAGLHQIHAAVAARRPVAYPPSVVRRLWTIRELDRRTVVPRFGFASPEDYYREASVGPRLGDLGVPALLVAAEDDPMVPPEAILPWLGIAAGRLQVRWARRGGHLGFPADLDLGLGEAPGLDAQLLGWLLDPSGSHRAASPTATSPSSSTSP